MPTPLYHERPAAVMEDRPDEAHVANFFEEYREWKPAQRCSPHLLAMEGKRSGHASISSILRATSETNETPRPGGAFSYQSRASLRSVNAPRWRRTATSR